MFANISSNGLKQSRLALPFLVCGFFFLLSTGCGNRDQPQAEKIAAPNPSAALPNKTAISQDIARAYIGLTSDARLHPDRNALATFATAFGWQEVPEKIKSLVNAKEAYAGTINGQMVIAGSDGSNDILSLTLRDHFAPKEILSELKAVYTLKSRASDVQDGQRTEMYAMLDGTQAIGLAILTYGAVAAIEGTGTLAYMSIDRARSELPNFKE